MGSLTDFPGGGSEMRGLDLMNRALDRIYDAAYKPPSPTAVALSRALCAERIAHALCDAAHLEIGAEPRPLAEVLPMARERFRVLAERAIQSLNVHAYDDAIEYAVNETLIWLEGKARIAFLDGPEPEDIIREALSHFLAHQSRPAGVR